jgi:uncharacterized membrane protein YciS (DUF1049 family)
MPIDPKLGAQLADLGGFALLIVFAIVVAVGFLRRWWVFGWLFDERTAERDAARAEVKQLQLAVSKLTARLSRERPLRSGDPDA